MDLLSGFYQVRMRESDIPKIGFVTPYGNFEFKVMPMGLCGAPSTFQFLMDSAFREPSQVGNSTLAAETLLAVDLDDICIFFAFFFQSNPTGTSCTLASCSCSFASAQAVRQTYQVHVGTNCHRLSRSPRFS
jgi:hypothetical protein